jgi:pimeloyl-ACP methyl ester carboxylesterase
MWLSRGAASAALLVLALAATSCRNDRSATIVVDLGRYPSADSAAHDEAHVDWADADPRDDAICTSTFAACELQRYLRRVTGDSTGFAIVDDDSLPAGDLILVGGSDANRATARLAPGIAATEPTLAARGPEGYVVRSFREHGRRIVVLAGATRVGTLHAAYDFLERAGVRWFAPGDVHEEVPSRPWPRVAAVSAAESPRFETRGFHAWEDRGDDEFFEWMARNRLNTWCVEEDERPLLHKLGILLAAGGHDLTARVLDPRATYPYAHRGTRATGNRPADPYPVSLEFAGDVNHDGRLSYFEAHPEWYGLQRGRRSANIVGDRGDNFCTSNADAVSEWAKNIVADLATGPYRDADILNVWMLDRGTWCMCARCRALGTPTDRLILLVNRLNHEIAAARVAGRIHRPIRLFFPAYAETAVPPTRRLPRDFDDRDCVAMFFPIVRCYAHHIDDPTCDTNAEYVARLRGWAVDAHRLYRGRVGVGEYYNVSGYKSLPLCLMHVMQHDIPYYAGLGIRDFNYMHCTTENWGNKALTNWQLSRQLWNPGVECSALWDDYFAGRYGAAGPSMRRAYLELEVMLRNVSDLKYGLARRLREGIEPLFAEGHLRYDGGALSLTEALGCAAACRRMMDDVLSRSLPDRVRRRVLEDERMFTYGERTIQFFDALCRASARLSERDVDGSSDALADARRLADALEADTTSTRFSSSHANAVNALEASGVDGVLERLASEWSEADEQRCRTGDPYRQPLVLAGRDLSGGEIDEPGSFADALRATGHASMPPRRVVPGDSISACFVLERDPARDLVLSLTGFERAGPEVAARAAVMVNGNVVAAGALPAAAASSIAVTLPASVLERGRNRIELHNLGDGAGGEAWFRIASVEVGEMPKERAATFDTRGPQDLALTYTSRVDGSTQRYRLYLPSAYDGKTRLPMLVALHGTTGSENSFFDDTSYGQGGFRREAEKRGVIVVCPSGRGDTEYRGIGELDVLEVMDHVSRDFRVDTDRVVCCGYSMGGTGTTYLAARHPDRFAAGVALSSSYVHLELIENLRHVPMLFVQGRRDWPVYASEGPLPITERLRELGFAHELWMLPGVRHNTLRTHTAQIMDWALQHTRTRDPEHVTYATYLPHDAKAYWTEITEFERPGALARIDARRRAGNRIEAHTSNVGGIVLRPNAPSLDPARPIVVDIDGVRAYEGPWDEAREIACTRADGRWRGTLRPRESGDALAYHRHRVGTVVTPPTQDGDAETTMGDWMADMMRSVSGADIAIYTGRDDRGVRLHAGDTLYTEDLCDWIRPHDRHLCTFRCTGRELVEILEANLADAPEERNVPVQISGCRYTFDRRRESGHRVVTSTIEPMRTYTIVCEGQVRTRETIRLAGLLGRLRFTELEPTAVSAAWAYIVERGGIVTVERDGRVREVSAPSYVATRER